MAVGRARTSVVFFSVLGLVGASSYLAPAGAQTTGSTPLHDQYNNSTQTHTNSQNYDAASDDYDDEAADDFQVPAGATWRIGTVEVAGQYEGSSRPTGINVTIYDDEGGLPGARLQVWTNLQPTGGFAAPNFSDFSIPLPDANPLTAGHYWISVQADLVSGSHWFWRNRSVTTLDPAVWRNEGGEWGSVICSDWEPRAATCAPSAPDSGLSATDPDQVFRLLPVNVASTARNIQLCQGDVAGSTCDVSEWFNDPNSEHELVARVTNRRGNPVANVPVQFRETGPAAFTPQGGDSATVNTDSNGLAYVLITSSVEGGSTVVAEISPQGTTGGFRGAGSSDDECEQAAGTNNNPPAGNCISQTLTKTWKVGSPDPECDDGKDNDGDQFLDAEDPGCTDGTESPVNESLQTIRHTRSISIRFNDGTGARNNGLVVFGRLRVADGFADCMKGQPVDIQRRQNDSWVTKKTTSTNRRGRYAVEIFDQASRYRVVATRTEILDEDVNELHVCVQALKAKVHRHRT